MNSQAAPEAVVLSTATPYRMDMGMKNLSPCRRTDIGADAV